MPSDEDVERAIQAFSGYAAYEYFFDHLQSPAWIDPLLSKDFFSAPPEPTRQDDYVQFPIWPESRYLVRVASIAPMKVLEVIRQMPATDNPRVYEDLVEAALSMPIELSVTLVDDALAWANTPYQLALPAKLANLFASWAGGGRPREAMRLARKILEILPDPEAAEKLGASSLSRPTLEPRAKLDTWHYEEVLKEEYSILIDTVGLEALQLLSELLETTINYEIPTPEEKRDYSYIWRPAIGNEVEYHHYRLRDVLVTGVRDGSLRIVDKDNTTIEQVISILESYDYSIFKRIALYVLEVRGELAPIKVKERILDRELFDDYEYREEYSGIIGKYFGILEASEKAKILEWIGTGPDVNEYLEFRRRDKTNPPTDQDIERYVACWQRDRLSWIRDSLDTEWKSRFEKLVIDYGEPESPNRRERSVSWVGPESPKTKEELEGMSANDILAFLKTWMPETDFRKPTPEGLSRTLVPIIETNPNDFLTILNDLKQVDPTYINAFIMGFKGALKKEASFDWQPVLDLCTWVVSQPREIPGRKKSDWLDIDPDWGWTRQSIAELITAGLDDERLCIPYSFRQQVWGILSVLVEDIEPTMEDEERHSEAEMSAFALSINTVRGKAIHSVMRYAVWVRKCVEGQGNVEVKTNSFSIMPEAEECLNDHLLNDPSAAVRSMYGASFNVLLWLDSEWVKDDAHIIFPVETSESKLWKASWEAYMAYSRISLDNLTILHDQYSHAVTLLAGKPDTDTSPRNPCFGLAEHMMVFYRHGALSLEDPLIQEFWASAGDKTRAHALGFIGRSLVNCPELEPGQETLERLRALWDYRRSQADSATAKDRYSLEMASFGFWFASAKFEDAWSLSNLYSALVIARNIDNAEEVVERMLTLVNDYPNEVIDCLEILIRSSLDLRGVYIWRDNAKEILAIALETDATDKARVLIHFLGSRGHEEFRDLL